MSQIAQNELMWGDDKLLPAGGDYVLAQTHDGLRYLVSGSLLAQQPNVLREHRVAITAYVLQHAGEKPAEITSHNINEIILRRPPTVKRKLDVLLKELARGTNFQVGRLKLSGGEDSSPTNSLMRAAGLSGHAELRSLLTYANGEGLLWYEANSSYLDVRTTIPGIVYVEEMEAPWTESTTAFAAMWFSPEMDDAYNLGIAPAITESGFEPVKINDRHYNNKIDDEIIREIRRARFIVADFSCDRAGARGGVYFEAGFALALEKDVIFTVRKADLKKVHFDTNHFNHIVWSEPGDLYTQLVNRIGATIVVKSH